jgi:hypothetical protein
MGILPYSEENNVREASRPIFIPGKHLMDATPHDAVTKTAAPGQTALFDIKVMNQGNLSDTYTITAARQGHTWTVTVSPTLPTLAGAEHALPVRIQIPPKTPEDFGTQTILTIQSTGDATLARTILLNAVSKTPKIYLPIVLKKK